MVKEQFLKWQQISESQSVVICDSKRDSISETSKDGGPWDLAQVGQWAR